MLRLIIFLALFVLPLSAAFAQNATSPDFDSSKVEEFNLPEPGDFGLDLPQADEMPLTEEDNKLNNTDKTDTEADIENVTNSTDSANMLDVPAEEEFLKDEQYESLQQHFNNFMNAVGRPGVQNRWPEEFLAEKQQRRLQAEASQQQQDVLPDSYMLLTDENDFAMPEEIEIMPTDTEQADIHESQQIQEKQAIDKQDAANLPPMPIPQQELSADEKMIRRILEYNAKLTKEQVMYFTGSCLLLPDHIEQCSNFSCTFPDITGQGEMQVSIDGIKDDKCSVNLTRNKLACRLSDNTKMFLSSLYMESFRDGVQTPNISTESLQNLATTSPVWRQLSSECKSTDTSYAMKEPKQDISNEQQKTEELAGTDITKTKDMNSMDTKQEPASIADAEASSMAADDLQNQLDIADQAYIAHIDEKVGKLPKDKRLPSDTKETLKNVVDNMMKNQADSKDNKEVKFSKGQDLSLPNKTADFITSDKNINLTLKNNTPKREQIAIGTQNELAYKALLSGQTEAAITLYKQVLDREYNNKTALFGLATAYHRNKQLKQAKMIYTELLAIEPENKEALNNFLALVADESPDEAIYELKKLERINPEYSPLPAQIAMIYVKKGDLQEAERNLKKALSMDPQNMSYIYNIAVISDQLKKRGQAAAFYRQLVRAEKSGAIIPGTIEQIKERLAYLESVSDY